MDEKTLRKHREKLDKALAANRDDEAIKLLAILVGAEPTNARWPHKRGDLLRKVGRRAEAVASYEQAVDVYAKTGFIARAVAMAKTVLSLDPTRTDVLARVDPQAAQELHRKSRPGSVAPGPIRSGSQSGAVKHPAVLDDAVPQPSAAEAAEEEEITVEVEEEPVEGDVEAAAPAAPEKVDVAAALAARKRQPTLSDADTMAVPVIAPSSPKPVVTEKADVAAALAARKRRPSSSEDDAVAAPAVSPSPSPAPVRPSPRPGIPEKVDVAAALAARRRRPTLLGGAEAVQPSPAAAEAEAQGVGVAAEGTGTGTQAEVPLTAADVAGAATAASPPAAVSASDAAAAGAARPSPAVPRAATVTAPGGHGRGRAAPPPPPPPPPTAAARPKAPPPPIPGAARPKPQPLTEPLTLDRLSLPPTSEEQAAAEASSAAAHPDLQPLAAADAANDSGAAAVDASASAIETERSAAEEPRQPGATGEFLKPAGLSPLAAAAEAALAARDDPQASGSSEENPVPSPAAAAAPPSPGAAVRPNAPPIASGHGTPRTPGAVPAATAKTQAGAPFAGPSRAGISPAVGGAAAKAAGAAPSAGGSGAAVPPAAGSGAAANAAGGAASAGGSGAAVSPGAGAATSGTASPHGAGSGAHPGGTGPFASPPLAAGAALAGARPQPAASAFGMPPAAAGRAGGAGAIGAPRAQPAASAFGSAAKPAGAANAAAPAAGAANAAAPPARPQPSGSAFGSPPAAAGAVGAPQPAAPPLSGAGPRAAGAGLPGAKAPPLAAGARPGAPLAAPPPAAASVPDGSHSGQLWADRSGGQELPAPPPAAAQPPGRHRGPTMLGAGPRIKPYEPPPEEAELFSRALEAAVELKVAPDAKPNETRFSDAPPSPAVELSTAEVSDRPPAALHEEHDAVPRAAGDLSNLPLFPLFAEMPKDVLAAMIQDTELIQLSDGDAVLRKGDPGDALFGIVEGSVAVGVPNQAHTLTLAEGDVFGESCLLQDEPRHADVRVIGRLTALKIPRQVLLRTLRGYPKLAELLLELLTRRLLANLLQTSPLFSEFDAEGRRELSRMFEVRRAPANTRLAIAGKRMDGLYISLTGTLLVEAPGEEPRIVPPGSMFGQHTLLSQQPSPSTVTARVNLVVLRLPSAAFAQVAMQHPTVVERLAELSTSDVVSVGL